MGHTKDEIYFHIVWATRQREPILTADVEPLVYGCIRGEVRRLGAVVLALGGTDDHVHLAVTTPSAVSAAQLMKQVKGASSRFANDQGHDFRWQPGYNVLSLSRPHLANVIPYVQNRKRHHATGKLWPDWEPDD